jgi:bifunctional NMN adenylyltransferase/nudix hydrolase
MPTYDFAVFIGRFQPIHDGHLKTIKIALSNAKKLILVIGSYKRSRSTRNPWTAQERMLMIKSCLTSQERKRIHFVFIRDRIYDEQLWKNNIITEVSKRLKENKNSKITLIGYEKDSSSYYLKHFPQWDFFPVDFYKNLNSSDFRNQFFLSKKISYTGIPPSVKKILIQYKKSKSFQTLKEEYEYERTAVNQEAEKKNYSVILRNGYVWLLKRKILPGKSLFSLPERLDPAIKSRDDKNKSRDDTDNCPEMKYDKKFYIGEWFLLDDLYKIEDKFFSDHFQIISYFLRNSRNPSS